MKSIVGLLTLASVATAMLSDKKSSRALSLFSLVSFPNIECTTASTDEGGTHSKGTCMTSDECSSKSGTISGKCASGFGACCKFTLTACGGTVSQNLTYVQNPSYPTAESGSTAMSCVYVVNAVASAPAVVQIRLDFEAFVVRQPETSGSCDDDTIKFTTPTGNGMALPTLCGTLTDQHIYIETGLEISSAATFTIATNTDTGTSRTWNIKVSHIPGHTKWMAIPDCLQYHTGHSGTFRSFNHPTGNFIKGQLYQICIRQEEGSCSIAYTTRQVDSSVDAFDMRGEAAKRTRGCKFAHINIRGNKKTGDVYCGAYFNDVVDDKHDGVVHSFRTPFSVYVYHSNADQTIKPTLLAKGFGNKGFSLQYQQLPCGQHYSEGLEDQ